MEKPARPVWKWAALEGMFVLWQLFARVGSPRLRVDSTPLNTAVARALANKPNLHSAANAAVSKRIVSALNGKFVSDKAQTQ